MPKNTYAHDENHRAKLAELRGLFRLPELRTLFNQENFEDARNTAREAQGFPEENI